MNLYFLELATFGYGSSCFCVVKAESLEKAIEDAKKRYPKPVTGDYPAGTVPPPLPVPESIMRVKISMAPCELKFDDAGVSEVVEVLW